LSSLRDLAFYNNSKDRSYLFGMDLMAANYSLKRKTGQSGDIFGLYVVSSDAPNYGMPLRVVEGLNSSTFSTTNGLMTIMTRG
ncbi:hypothetical protein PMAYCL1PPCAC_01603, partial [Pristionchus mayeri]